mmetsp:Transcript_20928/g.45890  ORF Transcript_20928/g.45890 Transcript_20928/m.45890 type:complete len:205 (+) Transcript_20928:539-1153(+)
MWRHTRAAVPTSMHPFIMLQGVHEGAVFARLYGPMLRSPVVRSRVIPLSCPLIKSGTVPHILQGCRIMSTASDSFSSHATPVSLATFWYCLRRVMNGQDRIFLALGPSVGAFSCIDRRQRAHRSAPWSETSLESSSRSDVDVAGVSAETSSNLLTSRGGRSSLLDEGVPVSLVLFFGLPKKPNKLGCTSPDFPARRQSLHKIST